MLRFFTLSKLDPPNVHVATELLPDMLSYYGNTMVVITCRYKSESGVMGDFKTVFEVGSSFSTFRALVSFVHQP